MSVFFSKSKLAAIMAPFVHFAAIMPRFIFFRTSSGQAIVGKTVAALLPPSAFSFGNPTDSFCVRQCAFEKKVL
jgi:hypothetical protein